MFQWLGLANAAERLSLGFANQLVDPIDHLFVLLLPIQIVFPCLVRENQLHLARFRSTPLPAFN